MRLADKRYLLGIAVDTPPRFPHLRRQRYTLLLLWNCPQQIAVVEIQGFQSGDFPCGFRRAFDPILLRLKGCAKTFSPGKLVVLSVNLFGVITDVVPQAVADTLTVIGFAEVI